MNFDKSILRREIHLPSLAQEWQIPEKEPFPVPQFLFSLLLPLELQETSYFAESAKIFNLSITSIRTSKQTFLKQYITQTCVYASEK